MGKPVQKKDHAAGQAGKDLEGGWRRPGDDEVVELVAHLTLDMVRSVKGRRVAEGWGEAQVGNHRLRHGVPAQAGCLGVNWDIRWIPYSVTEL